MLGGDSWAQGTLLGLLASGPLHLLPLRGPCQMAPFHASGHLLREALHHAHLEKEAGCPPQGPLPTRLPGPYLKCGDDRFWSTPA